ncbi:hypothetical protein NMG60_11025964 [Bertholletia excelsa]
MKFMKLGSKPDSFQTDGDNVRYVATELATDIAINVGDVKFYLHKFPLLSKSARLQKLVALTNGETNDAISICDIPGGPAAFEICAKFCYGMTVTLNAYNVVAARCAAEYLEMYETVEKGNLVYKIEVFLTSSIFRSWKDSIIVLQTTKSLLPLTEELKIVNHCLDAIASKACVDTSKVEWSYTYNRKKLPSENGNDQNFNEVRKQQVVPKDWWVEDLCDLKIDLYRRVITTIKTKGTMSNDVIGEALKTYATRRLPGTIRASDVMKYRPVAETVILLLPTEKSSIPCSFLLNLLKAATSLECGEVEKKELMRRIGHKLDEATVADLLIFDIELVEKLVYEFLQHERGFSADFPEENEILEVHCTGFGLDASKAKVAKLIDSYLAEIAKDPNLTVSKFVELAQMVANFPRVSHDGLYRAIDVYLKEHQGISKSERKRMCRLMDCKKFSSDACAHAVQNERLPLRVVVQVLFFEQARTATPSSSGGCGTPPDLPGSVRAALLPGGSHGSSRSAATTNTEEDWDSEELKALKGEIASLRLGGVNNSGKVVAGKQKNAVMSNKIFTKLLSGRERLLENSSSDTSEETKSNPSRSRRHSLSP